MYIYIYIYILLSGPGKMKQHLILINLKCGLWTLKCRLWRTGVQGARGVSDDKPAVLKSSLTIHLALVRQDDLPPATRRVDSQGFLKALLDVGAPHPLGVPVQPAVRSVAQPLLVAGILLPSVRAATATPL